MYRETSLRSAAKTITYRVLGSGITAAAVYWYTGRIGIAAALGGVDVLAKLAVFYLHERVWDHVRFGRVEYEPFVLWFTGLSGSGKTTLAKNVAAELRKSGAKVEYLDGDEIRHLFPATGFTRQERIEHLRRVGLLTSYLEKHGIIVVAAFISPYAQTRAEIRGLCRNFVEVHVATPLAECERRDVKGLYARARKGELRNFTGLDEPYEEPLTPEVRVDASLAEPADGTQRILEYVRRYGG